ncbi:hypothetical protein F5X96DRAFT_624849 [Biscogniauxia mediterranea]|nr:hypothetical protein F5X96DRAFT_624849 [Biscogniauxia mediterranea]
MALWHHYSPYRTRTRNHPTHANHYTITTIITTTTAINCTHAHTHIHTHQCTHGFFFIFLTFPILPSSIPLSTSLSQSFASVVRDLLGMDYMFRSTPLCRSSLLGRLSLWPNKVSSTWEKSGKEHMSTLST